MFWDITTWFFIFVRFGAYVVLFPVTSAQNVPVMLRLAISGLGAFIIMPLVPPVTLTDQSIVEIVRMFFVETSTGLTLGLVARFILHAVEVAGGLVATETGLMLSSNFNPITSTFASPPGLLLHWMTLILLLTLDLHHWILIGLQKSYEIVPAGGAHFSEALLSEVLFRSGSIFVVALQMTAPIMACSFIVTIVFALLGRAVPQMNVFNESFPVRSIAGLAVFGLTLNIMAQHIANQLNRIPDDFIRITRLMAR